METHRAEVEAEYQQALKEAEELRKYYEEQNRERVARSAANPPKPGTEAAWKDKKVKLFRVTVSTHRTDDVATNDLSQTSTDAVQDVCGTRWKIEEFHRELKQLTGVEACQCRKALIQRVLAGRIFCPPTLVATTLSVPCSFDVGSSRAPT